MSEALTLMSNTDKTVAYYDERARSYAEDTQNVDMRPIYRVFLENIPSGGRILDAGCGAGRDVREFLKRGYEVDAFDASQELCRIGSRETGIQIKHATFQEFSSEPVYDGIWACASLLHVPQSEMHDVLDRLLHALKPAGALYASFKHGRREERVSDGRFFIDMDEERLQKLFQPFSNVRIDEIWITQGEGNRAGHGEWINITATKRS